MNGTKTKSANLLSGPAGTRKERHSQEPGASRRTGWLLVQCSVILPLLVMGASHGYAQTIPCGGEGQRVCEITDIDAYNEPFPFVAYDTGFACPPFTRCATWRWPRTQLRGSARAFRRAESATWRLQESGLMDREPPAI